VDAFEKTIIVITAMVAAFWLASRVLGWMERRHCPHVWEYIGEPVRIQTDRGTEYQMHVRCVRCERDRTICVSGPHNLP
jgi:hypothetical protein